jgi:hypothetical protein
MKVIKKQHVHVRRWLLVNTKSATLASMLTMSGSMILFMGKLLWFNKLQMEILQNVRKKLCNLSQFSIFEVGMTYDKF